MLKSGLLALLIVVFALMCAPASTLAEPFGGLSFDSCHSQTPDNQSIGTLGCAKGNGLNGAWTATVSSPDGKNVYVASVLSDAVAAFSRDTDPTSPTFGKLTQVGCISQGGVGSCTSGKGLDGAISVAVSPNGKNVYVTSRVSDGVAVFSRDTATGALTQLEGPAGCVSEGGLGACSVGRALDHAVAVTVSPDDKNVYVVGRGSDSVAVFSRDTTTGALTQLEGTAGCFSDPAPTTGAFYAGCSEGRALDGAFSVTLRHDTNGSENVYAASRVADGVAAFKRDTTTGKLTQLPGSAGCITNFALGDCTRTDMGLDGATSVAVSGDGGNAYVASYQTDAVSTFQRDTTDSASPSYGKLAQIGCISQDGVGGCAPGRALDYADALTVSPDNKSVYVAAGYSNAVASFSRDAATGALEQLEDDPTTTTQSATGATVPAHDGCISWRGTRWVNTESGASEVSGTDGYCIKSKTLYFPYSLEVGPDGNSVYVASERSDAVSALKRNTSPDTTPPTISSVSPSDSATGVAANTNVSVGFSEPMDRAASVGAFSLVRSSDNSPIAGTFSWSASTMTFDPSTDLTNGVEQTARVTTAAKDKAGNALAAGKVWKFTITALTRAPPPVPTGPPTGLPPSPALKRDTAAPRLKLRVPEFQRVFRQRGRLIVGAECDEPCDLAVRANVTAPGASKAFQLKQVRRSLAASKRTTIRIKLSRKALAAVERALRRGKRVSASLKIEARDAAGNVRRAKRKIRLRR